MNIAIYGCVLSTAGQNFSRDRNMELSDDGFNNSMPSCLISMLTHHCSTIIPEVRRIESNVTKSYTVYSYGWCGVVVNLHSKCFLRRASWEDALTALRCYFHFHRRRHQYQWRWHIASLSVFTKRQTKFDVVVERRPKNRQRQIQMVNIHATLLDNLLTKFTQHPSAVGEALNAIRVNITHAIHGISSF